MKRRIAALAALGLLSACYSYKSTGPVDAVAPKVGKRVSVVLTQQGVVTLSPQLGPQATFLEGDVLEADSAGLRLALRRVEDSRHSGTDWKGEPVSIPRDAIASVSERQFSIGATALLSGLAVGGVIGAYAAFGTAGSTDGVAIPGPAGTQ